MVGFDVRGGIEQSGMMIVYEGVEQAVVVVGILS